MSNADPVDYLVMPRFVACTVMTLMLTVYGGLVAVACGAFIGVTVWGIEFDVFMRLTAVQTGDAIGAILKALAYGMAIPVICAQAGLETRGGSEGVGEATTNAVVNSSFAVIVLDLAISVFGYFFLVDPTK